MIFFKVKELIYFASLMVLLIPLGKAKAECRDTELDETLTGRIYTASNSSNHPNQIAFNSDGSAFWGRELDDKLRGPYRWESLCSGNEVVITFGTKTHGWAKMASLYCDGRDCAVLIDRLSGQRFSIKNHGGSNSKLLGTLIKHNSIGSAIRVAINSTLFGGHPENRRFVDENGNCSVSVMNQNETTEVLIERRGDRKSFIVSEWDSTLIDMNESAHESSNEQRKVFALGGPSSTSSLKVYSGFERSRKYFIFSIGSGFGLPWTCKVF
jgi:hypothetical protein